MKKKKLQVFISSTFIDLIEERQAAVQAVLSCGHIPAGMELFTAGDESQMKVIKRWIEESDVYLLILGGRYGSIEPTSGKSYTQLEYEYAISLRKPFFAVVISENANEAKIRTKGSAAIEKYNPQKLADFRREVLTKMVKFFDDNKDIKLAVHETMSEFERREDLLGWVRSDEEIDTGNLAEELARLAKENSILRKQLNEISSNNYFPSIGLDMLELEKIMKARNIDEKEIPEKYLEVMNGFREKIGDEKFNLLHFLWAVKEELAAANFWAISDYYDWVSDLKKFGLVYMADDEFNTASFTDDGRKFYMKYLVKYGD